MWQRIGVILVISGMSLLVGSSGGVEALALILNYLLIHYWPLVLIYIGYKFMIKKPKRAQNKR